jgi:type VI protein secretion system component Hcp
LTGEEYAQVLLRLREPTALGTVETLVVALEGARVVRSGIACAQAGDPPAWELELQAARYAWLAIAAPDTAHPGESAWIGWDQLSGTSAGAIPPSGGSPGGPALVGLVLGEFDPQAFEGHVPVLAVEHAVEHAFPDKLTTSSHPELEPVRVLAPHGLHTIGILQSLLTGTVQAELPIAFIGGASPQPVLEYGLDNVLPARVELTGSAGGALRVGFELVYTAIEWQTMGASVSWDLETQKL